MRKEYRPPPVCLCPDLKGMSCNVKDCPCPMHLFGPYDKTKKEKK